MLDTLRRLPLVEFVAGSSFFGVTAVFRLISVVPDCAEPGGRRLHANDGNKYDDDELLLNELVDE